MTQHDDPQPSRPLEYRVGTEPLNSFQRWSVFVLRVVGLLLMVYAAIGVVGLIGSAAVGVVIYSVGHHVIAICEYGLVGVLAAVFSHPLGRWLGAAA